MESWKIRAGKNPSNHSIQMINFKRRLLQTRKGKCSAQGHLCKSRPSFQGWFFFFFGLWIFLLYFFIFLRKIDSFFFLIGVWLLYTIVLVFLLYNKGNQPNIYISPLLWISFPFRSPKSTEESCLCYTVGSH